LILSDKNLPAMNGLELLSLVRSSEQAHGILRGFVLVTGYPSRESALAVLAEGGDGYLVKPFRSLVHAVDEVRTVLDAPLADKRLAGSRARLLAEVLGGAELKVEPNLAVSFLLDDDDSERRAQALAVAAGAHLVPLGELEQAAA